VALAGLPGARVLESVPPLAPAIAAIAQRRAEQGLAVPPHAVKPVYVRRPDAELARDRRLGAALSGGPARRDAHE
jgi:tRNA A37 threonylcarbamoyladenosine modification protein TsaB